MIMSAVNVVNPLWWVYTFFKALLYWVPLLVINFIIGICKLIKHEWQRFDSLLLKLTYTAAVTWVALPGTLPLMFYAALPYLQTAADFLGYGEEFAVLVNIVETGVSWAASFISGVWNAMVFVYNLAN